MKSKTLSLVAAALSFASTACSTPGGSLKGTLPQDEQAYAVIPRGNPAAIEDYRIGPLDLISVNVFKEPSLSFTQIPVDASGNIQFPLIGLVHAGGRSTTELAAELTRRLNDRYLRNAQVSVAVTEMQSRRVTVEGGVGQPGIYEIPQGATLLSAIALARSPVSTSDTGAVAVFRIVDNQRVGALFDLNAIRRGEAPDPQLKGGDTVVVGYSRIKGAFRDFLQAAPLIGVFRPF